MTELIEAKYGSEAGHFYTRSGEPAYEIIGKNGNRRPTTLRDAKALDLLPSVTTILKCAAAPGLVNWQIDQAILSALTLPRGVYAAKTSDGEFHEWEEPEAEWLARVRQDAKEQGRKAAERGTEIHACIEMMYADNPYGLPTRCADPAQQVAHAIDDYFDYGSIEWMTEQTFASPGGFGGKVDLYTEDGIQIVLDIKTKDAVDDTTRGFEEQAMQLAAYRDGLKVPDARCANVYVSRQEPWTVKVVEWSEADLQRGWSCFRALLDYYNAKTGLGADR